MSRWLIASHKRKADVTTDLKRAVEWLKEKSSELPGEFRQKLVTDPWNAAKEFLLGTESERYKDLEDVPTKRDDYNYYTLEDFYKKLYNVLKFRYENINQYSNEEHFDKFPNKIIPVGSDQVFIKDEAVANTKDYNLVDKKSKKYDEDMNYQNSYNKLGDKEIRSELICYYKADTTGFNGDTTNAPSGAIYADDPEYFYWKVGEIDGPWREKSKYRVVEY